MLDHTYRVQMHRLKSEQDVILLRKNPYNITLPPPENSPKHVQNAEDLKEGIEENL